MKALPFLACIALASLLVNDVFASPGDDIDQIVVTAARTPLTTRRVATSLTVIDREEIERREARHVAELLRSVPGFSVSHTGISGSQTQVRARGAEANHVLVLIDGVRANDPATGDEFRWEFLSTGDIEQIEIVRGPQSSLWGSDAVAAVVHIITRSGAAARSLGGYAESGSFGTTNTGLHGGLGTTDWSVDGSIESLNTSGENVSRTGSENDDADLITANLSARLATTDTLSFDFGIRAVDAYSQFDPVDFFVSGLPVDADVATDASNVYARIGAQIESPGGRIASKFDVRYSESDNRNLVGGIEDSSTASNRLVVSYQSDIGIGDNVLSLAIEREHTKFEQRGGVFFGDPNQDQKVDVTSVVADYQGLSNDRFTWFVSARFDRNSDFDDAVNGRIALSYLLSDALTLRTSVGTGTKTPTFTERFGFFPGLFAGNAALKPENSTSYDAGIDLSFPDDSMLLQLSLFRQDLKDEINGFAFDPPSGQFTAMNMSGTSDRSGAEVSLHWALNDYIEIGGHYTYTEATEQNTRELRRPLHSGGLSATLQSRNEAFGATLNADYGGTSRDVFFPPFPNPSQTVTLSNYWLLDLAARYRVTPSVTVFAKGTNLLDDDYEQVFGYNTLGRAGYVGVRMSFGNR